jgi:hypothetical protein
VSDTDPNLFSQATQELAKALTEAFQHNVGNPGGLAAALNALGLYDAYSASTFVGFTNGGTNIPASTTQGSAQIVPSLVGLFTLLTTNLPPFPNSTAIHVSVIGQPLGNGLASVTTVVSYPSLAGPVTFASSALNKVVNCGTNFVVVMSTSTLQAPPFP